MPLDPLNLASAEDFHTITNLLAPENIEREITTQKQLDNVFDILFSFILNEEKKGVGLVEKAKIQLNRLQSKHEVVIHYLYRAERLFIIDSLLAKQIWIVVPREEAVIVGTRGLLSAARADKTFKICDILRPFFVNAVLALHLELATRLLAQAEAFGRGALLKVIGNPNTGINSLFLKLAEADEFCLGSLANHPHNLIRMRLFFKLLFSGANFANIEPKKTIFGICGLVWEYLRYASEVDPSLNVYVRGDHVYSSWDYGKGYHLFSLLMMNHCDEVTEVDKAALIEIFLECTPDREKTIDCFFKTLEHYRYQYYEGDPAYEDESGPYPITAFCNKLVFAKEERPPAADASCRALFRYLNDAQKINFVSWYVKRVRNQALWMVALMDDYLPESITDQQRLHIYEPYIHYALATTDKGAIWQLLSEELVSPAELSKWITKTPIVFHDITSSRRLSSTEQSALRRSWIELVHKFQQQSMMKEQLEQMLRFRDAVHEILHHPSLTEAEKQAQIKEQLKGVASIGVTSEALEPVPVEITITDESTLPLISQNPHRLMAHPMRADGGGEVSPAVEYRT